MRRQWNSESAAAISNDRSPNRSRAAALVAAAALLIALAFAVPALASYTFQAKWGSPGSGNGQFSSPRGIATDSSGDVYVVDSGSHRIQKFSSAGTFITEWGGRGTGNGQFEFPDGIATDSSGDVYVADFGNARVQKFNAAGTFITEWGFSGTGDGQFSYPTDIATDSLGNVYVADSGNNRVQKFSSTGTFITKWGSRGTGDGQFRALWDVATDPSGDVYVVEGGEVDANNRIQKFSPTGTFITKWGSRGTGDGQFSSARGIATDSLGNVYVSDNPGNQIQKFSSTGTFMTKWGSRGTGDGQFDGAWGVDTDSSGNVYVVDIGNSRIQKFSKSTVSGEAKIGKVTVKGPAGVKKGKAYTYTATIQNSGNAEATGVRLKVSGRGLSFNASVGKIAAGKSRTVKVKLKPKKPGKIKATFKVTSSNAGSKTARKTITVRK